jgi:DNA-binding winged helix-turn-helix (wHTH) protein
MGLNTKCFYEFASYRREPEEHLLLRGYKPLPLGSKAFDLLIFLLRTRAGC